MQTEDKDFFDLIEMLHALNLFAVRGQAAYYIAQHPKFQMHLEDEPALFYYDNTFLTYEDWMSKLLERVWERREALAASALEGN